MAEREISIKQRKFADFYIELGNATEAAMRAGYSKRSARSIAAENLTKKVVKDYIAEVMDQKSSERIASQNEVLEFLTLVMRGEVKEQIPLLNGDGYQKLAELDAALPKDRIKAAELLGKRYALWKEKQEIEGSIGVQIIDDTGMDDEG